MAPRASSAAGGDTRALRQVMLEHLDRRCGKTASELFAEVRDDFGSCATRRLWHALAWLRKAGTCRREGRAYRNGTRYVRLTSTIPRLDVTVTCSICGAKGRTRQSHKRHALELERWPKLDARPKAGRASPGDPQA